MNNIADHKSKNSFSKWLFAAILLFSLFSFSGSAIQTPPDQFRLKTTLVAGLRSAPGKTIGYPRAYTRFYNQQASISFFLQHIFDASLMHSRQIKTQLQVCDELFIQKPQMRHQAQIIPLNIDDEPAINLA